VGVVEAGGQDGGGGERLVAGELVGIDDAHPHAPPRQMGRQRRPGAAGPDDQTIVNLLCHGSIIHAEPAMLGGPLDRSRAMSILPRRAPPMTEKSTHRFQAEVTKVLSLVIHSLYSNPEVFLRELVSNASDALDKLRFRSVTEPGLLPAGERLVVQLIPDPKARTLTISDNGVGMN